MRLFLNIIIAGMFLIPATIYSETKQEDMKPPLPLTHLKKRSVVKGEYLVTVRGGSDEKFLLSYFSRYKVIKIRKVSRGLYLIKITDDPGLEVLKGHALKDKRITDIQPNYVYHTLNSR